MGKRTYEPIKPWGVLHWHGEPLPHWWSLRATWRWLVLGFRSQQPWFQRSWSWFLHRLAPSFGQIHPSAIEEKNESVVQWRIGGLTWATDCWYSAFFSALSCSISLAASVRASFKRWIRSDCPPPQNTKRKRSVTICFNPRTILLYKPSSWAVMSLGWDLRCLAFWTIFAASRSASKRVLIPWVLEVAYTITTRKQTDTRGKWERWDEFIWNTSQFL